MGEDEFKIDDPIAERVASKMKIKEMDIAKDMLAVDIMCQKKCIEIDSIFQIPDYFEDRDTCGLLPSVTCSKPHCSSCNIPMLFASKSRMMLEHVWQHEVNRHVKEVREATGGLFDILKEMIDNDGVELDAKSLLDAFNKGLKGGDKGDRDNTE